MTRKEEKVKHRKKPISREVFYRRRHAWTLEDLDAIDDELINQAHPGTRVAKISRRILAIRTEADWGPLSKLCYHAGVHPGSARFLEWKNVNLKDKYFEILVRNADRARIRIISDELAKSLEAWRKTCRGAHVFPTFATLRSREFGLRFLTLKRRLGLKGTLNTLSWHWDDTNEENAALSHIFSFLHALEKKWLSEAEAERFRLADIGTLKGGPICVNQDLPAVGKLQVEDNDPKLQLKLK
jgi:integrase